MEKWLTLERVTKYLQTSKSPKVGRQWRFEKNKIGKRPEKQRPKRNRDYEN